MLIMIFPVISEFYTIDYMESYICYFTYYTIFTYTDCERSLLL